MGWSIKLASRGARVVQSKSRGFTIIEVLIVLAIGGLIMLIVFQAIPTVLRNSRNSDRKHDVAAILDAVSHYELNHSGNFPDSGSNFLQYTKLQQYRPAVVQFDPTAALNSDTNIVVYAQSASFRPYSNQLPSIDGAMNPVTSQDMVAIYKYQRCNTNNDGGSSSIGAGYYDTVALFATETATGVSSQCEQL